MGDCGAVAAAYLDSSCVTHDARETGEDHHPPPAEPGSDV